MLGLRKNPLKIGRRNRDSTSSLKSSNTETGSIEEETSSNTRMSAPTTSSQASLAKNSIEESTKFAAAENAGSDSFSVTSTEALTMVNADEPHTSYEVMRVMETARLVQKKLIREVDEVTERHFHTIDLEAYLAYIADERLVDMPTKGSQWDRVLMAAEFFGLQLDEFAVHVGSFVQGCTDIRDTALATCYLLLELGRDQAEALEPTFNALYELGLLLDHTIRLSDLFSASDAIRYELSHILNSLVQLVADITVHYRTRINSIYTGSVTIDFDAEFGSQISDIWSQREHLHNHMWAHKLGNKHRRIDITTLRRHLLPTRESVNSIVYGRVANRKLRVDGTCEWIKHDLHDFLGSGDDIFTITGGEGCGKSMLAAWMRERLERPVNRTQFETISYTFSGDVPSETTPIAFLKSLLSQLLETNVGDIVLFERLATIFGNVSPYQNSARLEADLWEVLGSNLASIDKNKKTSLAIIIDGMDEVSGGASKAEELHKKLHTAISKLSSIQAITFSRPVSHLGGNGCKHMVITPEHVRNDIELFLDNRLQQNCCFKSQNDEAKRNLVKQLADQAKGSFLFAYLADKLFTATSDFSAFKKTIANCKSDVKVITGELMKKISLNEEFGESKTYNLFTFMTAAQRTLTVGEMSDLLGVNLSTRTVASGADVLGPVSNTKGLVIVHRGTLRFKHSTIRKHIMDLCGSTLMAIKDAHRHITMALLLFAKSRITYSCEPSMELIAEEIFQDCFHAHQIVGYMMRHWISHFRSSSLYGQNSTINLTSEFKEVFPESTFFAMLEWYNWQSEHEIKETIEMHDLSLRIRSACFGEKHRSYLQNLIILGSLHRRCSDLTIASEFFYKASYVGQVVLYKFSPLVVSCTNLFLTCTETITSTKRTVLVTHREEMIKFMIEVCKGKQGGNSDAVIKWYEVLAKLYVDVKEEESAMIIYKELDEILTFRFGKGSKREGAIAEKLSGMEIVLNADDKKSHDIDYWRHLLFETTEEMSFTDVRRIKILFSLASEYENQRMFMEAEKLYVTLWRSILEACRLKSTTELHLQKINISIEYIQFLQRIKRNEEACNIMICVWAEYENHTFESEKIMIRLRELGIIAKSFGILSVSMSIFKKVWCWFKEKKTIESEEATSTAVYLTEVVEEITERVVETHTTTTVVETVTKEIWETNYSRCKGGKADKNFFKASIALVNLYLKLENWSEAEVVLRKTLEVTWKSVLSVETKLTLEGVFVSERIMVAKRLALCYHRQRKFDRAEEIYRRMYRACLSSLHVENVLVIETASALVEFYEEYHRHEKVIDVYVELLQHCRKSLAAGHSLTVKVIYKLAAVYQKLGRKEAYDCYSEIVTVSTKGGCCHGSALDAAIIVLNHYYAEQRWAELQKICATLWTTFVHHNHETKFTEAMVELIYQRYNYVLEFHSKVEFSVRYKITTEYRDTAIKIFRASSDIVIKSLISLAELCESNEEHYHESVTIYEEIIRKNTTTTIVTDTTVKTIRKRLSKLYVTFVTSGKATTTTTIERAIAVNLEIYEQLKLEFGWWHEKTLVKLKEVVLLYKKSGSKEAHSRIIQLLQVSAIHIVMNVKDSMNLHTSAQKLASIYTASGMVQHGQDLLRQLRYLLLFPGFDGGEKNITIALPGKKRKVSLVFLIAFEQGLNADAKVAYTFSEIMADVLLETILYEQYIAVMPTAKDAKSIEVVIEHAARLRFVWESRGRTGFVSVLDMKLFSLFTTRYAKFLGPYAADANVTFEFYAALLNEIGGGMAADRGAIDFGLVSCKAAYGVVRKLMVENKDLGKADSVARCAFEFANSQRFYHNRRCHAWGFRLAELLAGIGVANWKSADANLKDRLITTSRNVLQHVLASMREDKIDFTGLRLEDISSLVYLLGEQKNYLELEKLLTSLWQSREVQRNCGVWTPDIVLNIGDLLVSAHEFASHLDQAVSLCETIYYNVRQSRGGLDQSALYFAKRLSYLLRRASRLRDAARVHLDVVCDLDEHITATRGVEKDERLRQAAETNLDGMRRCGWATRGDGVKTAMETLDRLRGYGKLNIPPVEQWTPVTAADEKKEANVTWNETIKWELTKSETEVTAAKKKNRDLVSPAKERWGRLGVRQPGFEAVY